MAYWSKDKRSAQDLAQQLTDGMTREETTTLGQSSVTTYTDYTQSRASTSSSAYMSEIPDPPVHNYFDATTKHGSRTESARSNYSTIDTYSEAETGMSSLTSTKGGASTATAQLKYRRSTLSSSKMNKDGESTTSSSDNQDDLVTNDTQFHVIATLIISTYEVELESMAPTIVISQKDKIHLNRMVPRDNFVRAVRERLKSCPEYSDHPVHVATRKCRALGLDREGNQNPLYAPAGTVIPINVGSRKYRMESPVSMQDPIQVDESLDGNPENLARQQVLAELREASNLMAESVTPEAAQFWRKHVVELQSRLRALHETPSNKSLSGDSVELMRNHERLLQENTGYVPPSREDFQPSPNHSPVIYTPPSTRLPETIPESPTTRLTIPEPPSNSLTIPEPPVETTKIQIWDRDPNLKGMPLVDVVAPADLPGGYTFEAEIDDHRFLATVPAGGVKKGESFSCYMRDVDYVGSAVPMGRWRDGPSDLFRYGLCHPLLLNAFFCPLIALAQIMTRMGLDFMGRDRRGSDELPKKGLFSTWGMVIVIICFWVFLNIIVLFAIGLKSTEEIPVSLADRFTLIIINAMMVFYVIHATAATRGSIRARYKIRDSRCGDSEDFIFATGCLPCTIAQMGRQTASFDEYNGICCNETGIPEGATVKDPKKDTLTYNKYRI